MAEESDQERNYPATSRRLEQARERGQVARSRELAAATAALVTVLAFWIGGSSLLSHCAAITGDGLRLTRDMAFDPAQLTLQLGHLSAAALLMLAPLFGLLLVVTVAGPLTMSGWVLAPQALTPDFSRLNPLRGVRNMVSGHSAVELLKAAAKCVLLGGIAIAVLSHDRYDLLRLAAQDPSAALHDLGGMLLSACFALSGGLALIAVIDVPYQLWRHHHGLRMTREEVRQEQREMDGDPQLKARIRNMQRTMARKRMMAAVPQADVIVTNPTHYAVALEYREDRMRAPRVIAKGAHLLAQRIREAGEAHNVPVLEAPPLARALYRHAEIGAEIPAALYAAVAQVLVYVYQLRHYREFGGAVPAAPEHLPVPAPLDPPQDAQ